MTTSRRQRLLRMAEQTSETPFGLEWTVPFGEAIFHLGIHNLPSRRAQEIVADLVAYTQHPTSRDLGDLIAMLDQLPEVLVIFNHPLWDLSSLGQQRYPRFSISFCKGTCDSCTRLKSTPCVAGKRMMLSYSWPIAGSA